MLDKIQEVSQKDIILQMECDLNEIIRNYNAQNTSYVNLHSSKLRKKIEAIMTDNAPYISEEDIEFLQAFLDSLNKL